jgi:hypothetical protein
MVRRKASTGAWLSRCLSSRLSGVGVGARSWHLPRQGVQQSHDTDQHEQGAEPALPAQASLRWRLALQFGIDNEPRWGEQEEQTTSGDQRTRHIAQPLDNRHHPRESKRRLNTLASRDQTNIRNGQSQRSSRVAAVAKLESSRQLRPSHRSSSARTASGRVIGDARVSDNRYGRGVETKSIRNAVIRCIAVWDHEALEARTKALLEVAVLLESFVAEQLDDEQLAASFDGLNTRNVVSDGASTLSISGAFWTLMPRHGGRTGSLMLPMDAVLSLEPGAVSSVRVAGRESLFEIPKSERQFQRAIAAAVWRPSFPLRLG